MHNTRLSIFILPVLIIGLSVFTTFVEENPSFRTLFQISQVANPSVNEEGQDIIDSVQTDQAEEENVQPSDSERTEEQSSETTGDTQRNPEETQVNESSQENIDRTRETVSDTPTDTTPTPDTSSSLENEELEVNTTPQNTEAEPSTELEDEEIKDAELLALKVAQFQVARSNISYKFQLNLSRLEDARDKLADKITAMEQEGKDTTQARDALMNLDQAIKSSRRYIKDSTVPDSIPGIQRLLAEYVKNARDSIQEGYTALFNAVKQAE